MSLHDHSIRSAFVLALGLVAACGSKGAPDFSERSLDTKSVTFENRDLALTIDVPEGLAEDSKSPSSVTWRLAEGSTLEKLYAPTVEVETQPSESTEALLEWAGSERLGARGFSVTRHDESDTDVVIFAEEGKTEDGDPTSVRVDRFVKAAGYMVHCAASQGSSSGLQNLEGTRTMVEKICESMAVPEDALAPPMTEEMKAFMSELGTNGKVADALAKYGVEGLNAKTDMGMYDLESPVVTTSVRGKTEGVVCHFMEAKAGLTTRTYAVCWKDGKIMAVEDKGITR